MNQTDLLREIVAKLAGVEAPKIGPDFSLQTGALKGSIKRAALAAAIRRDLGVNSAATHSVATFADLERAVLGTPSAASPPTRSAALSPVAQPSQPVAAGSPRMPANVRCGIDLEMISELPEATDYREHEFYQDTFTSEEIAYCLLQENPRMHFAARWCAKEALAKCDPAFRHEKMANVEVARSAQGQVSLRHRVNGSSLPLPHSVSLSHTNTFAAAVVVAGLTNDSTGGRGVDPAEALERRSTHEPAAEPAHSLSVLAVMAWMVSLGLALLALIRTFQ